MSEIIASTYELLEELGSGGGGVVYLANHLRLNKKVVLKADKRKITTKPELLRREVDILKDLTHSYIPKVFDFFAENETVYTVMDFIEGESLDKPLKRGEKISQPKAIEWARQLLEALDYLHTPTHGDPPRGFVHSDIKPANLMRTPYDKICLIDFNIALALGEKSAIGCSAGYASPEHYGIDYTNVGDHTGDTTIRLSPEDMSESVSASASSEKLILPDVRSDIYSTGATLYHLISGRRPAREATEVTPLTAEEASPQISAIIAKAMHPNPDLRYQTAAEMLYALNHLHENDVRTQKYRRSLTAAAVTLGTVFCLGVFTAFVGLKRMETTENRLKLAEYSENAAESGDTEKAIAYAIEANPGRKNIFTPAYIPEAQTALTRALGVYDLSDGFKPDGVIELPSAPLCLRLSPDGSRGACIYSGMLVIFDTNSREKTAELPVDISALSEVEFIDNSRVAYAGKDGISVYDVTAGAVLWNGRPATAISVSDDGKRVAALYKNENEAYIYDVSDGSLIRTISFGDKSQKIIENNYLANPDKSVFELDEKGNCLAVSFEDGTLSLFGVDDTSSNYELFDSSSGFKSYSGGFHGKYFAFSLKNSEGSAFAVVDCERMEQTAGLQLDGNYSAQADENGIYVYVNDLLAEVDPKSGEYSLRANPSGNITAADACGQYSAVAIDGGFMFYDKAAQLLSEYSSEFSVDFLQITENTALAAGHDTNTIRILKRESHSEADILCFDTDYSCEEVRLSADEKTVMLFSRTGFRIYDRNNNILCEHALDDYDMIYDQQFRRADGKSYLEVTYYDGIVQCYSAADGSLTDEYTVELSDFSADEEFFTDKLRIDSPLHGAPTVYDRESGKLIKELDSDAYLTYITQTDEYIVAQYSAIDGSYYGVLMNEKCETLAALPYLCDVVNGKLLFAYPTGNLRETRIYKLNELIELAQEMQQEDD